MNDIRLKKIEAIDDEEYGQTSHASGVAWGKAGQVNIEHAREQISDLPKIIRPAPRVGRAIRRTG